VAEAAWSAATGGEAAPVDPSPLLVAAADVNGFSVAYETCFPQDVHPVNRSEVHAAKQRVRYFDGPQGVRRIEVPLNYRAAMSHERAAQYWDAMCREMSAQKDKTTYTLVERSKFPDVPVYPLGWVYDNKVAETCPDGILDKARLIGRGDYMTEFFEIFAGVARSASIRCTLAYASQLSMVLMAGDVPTAYLNASIYDVIVLSEQPPGFEVPGPNGQPAGDMVARWSRALYGWKVSAFEWAEEFREWLELYGCRPCPTDVKVFVLQKRINETDMLLIICLHVDDLLTAHSHADIRERFMADCPYRIKELGRARRIFGGDVHQDLTAGIVVFNLESYLTQAAHRFQLTETAKSPTTPSIVAACRRMDEDPSQPTQAEHDSVADDVACMGGVAIFVASFIRVDLSFHAHYASTKQSVAGQPHLAFLRHLLAHAVTTKTLGLCYRRSDTFNATGVFHPGERRDGRLHGIGDASYVLPRGVSGSVVMLAGAAVAWRVYLNRNPALSPGEEEFYALTSTITETVTVRQLLEEVGHVFPAATQVFSDATVARAIAQHGATSMRTKFIERRYQFGRFYEEEGITKIMPVRGAVNPANILTKFVFGNPYFVNRRYLLGIDASDSLIVVRASWNHFHFGTA